MPPFLSPNWPSWTFQPIGVVQSPYLDRIEAPHQAVVSHGTLAGTAVEGVIALSPTLPEACLRDLEGFERLWVVWVFHRSDGWRPTVIPPRGPRRRRGVLATRSPHRPNALGLTAVELVSVDAEARTLRVRGLDMLDGTPVLDVKPYVPYADAFPGARAGWVDEVVSLQAGDALWAPGPKRPLRSTAHAQAPDPEGRLSKDSA